MFKIPRIKAIISRIQTSELLWPILVFLLFWGLMHIHSGIYEFSLGDNLVQFFPGMMHNGREFFSGYVPLLNYHHFLGYESLLTGYYGGFYVPTYGAYFIAHYVLGNDFALLGILAFYHYIVAFVGLYLLLRRFLGHKVFCCVVALGYVFAAKYINYAAEWWYVLVPMAYLPWITYFSLQVMDRLHEVYFNRKKMLIEVVLLSLLLSTMAFAGNSQLTLMVYVYGALFAFLYFLVKVHKLVWKRLVYLLLIVPLVIFGITAMLLCGEYVKESDSKRGHKSVDYMIGNKLDIHDATKYFVMAPFNHKIDFSVSTYETAHERFKPLAFWPVGFVSGAGAILFLLCLPWCFLMVIGKFWKLDDRKRVIIVAFVIAAFILLMACGYRPIYEILARSEKLSKLAHAHKNYFVDIFYIALFSGLFLGAFLENIPEKTRKFGYRVVIMLSIFTTVVNIVVVTQITQWNFTNEPVPIIPNPNLPKEKRMIHVGDFFEYQPGKRVCGEYMGFLCASLFDYQAFGGYEPLLPMTHSIALNNIAGRTDAGYGDLPYGLYEILKSFGVCNVVGRYASRSPEDLVREMRIAEGRSVVSEISEESYLVEDLDCYEYKSDRGSVTKRAYHGDRMVFDLQGVDEDTTLHIKNYILPQYRAYDQKGKRLEMIATEGLGGSIIGRDMIDVAIPAGTTRVTVRFHKPFVKLLFWMAFLTYGVGVYGFWYYFIGSSPRPVAPKPRKVKKVSQKSIKSMPRSPFWKPLLARLRAIPRALGNPWRGLIRPPRKPYTKAEMIRILKEFEALEAKKRASKRKKTVVAKAPAKTKPKAKPKTTVKTASKPVKTKKVAPPEKRPNKKAPATKKAKPKAVTVKKKSK
ncbi:MAG TPA: hypothetical protein VIT68_05395 [Candidatus Gracilibacteria bacterium]